MTRAAPAGLPEAQRRRSLFFLGLAVAGAGLAMALQLGLNENFLVEQLGVQPLQRGVLESVRELCGVAAIGVLALVAGLAEPVVGAAMLLLLGVGLGAYAFTYEYRWVVAWSLVWSVGFHVWVPLPQAMALALAEPGRAGHRLGQTSAAGAAGFGAGLGLALGLVLAGVAIRPLYLVAAAGGALGAAACLGIHRRLKTPGPKFVFRRRYALYYGLSFLEGWRKQIFICFAGFLLVRVHHTPLWGILALWMAVQAIGYVAAPRVGRLIDRVGERRVLVFYFASLAVFFVGYATVPSRPVLYAIFVADNAFFVFAMALTTYVNRIAPKEEHTPTLGMGVAVNHVAAVTMPLVGGVLWDRLGYQWPFLVGAAAAAASVLVALRVPRHLPAEAPAPPGGPETPPGA